MCADKPVKTRPADPFPMITNFTLEAIEAIKAGNTDEALKILAVLNVTSYRFAKDGWWDKRE